MTYSRWGALLLITVASLLTGCTSTQPTAAKPLDLDLYASSGVNLDGLGRPAPILVSIYGLKSAATFEASGFTALQDRAKATLGDDLVSFEQVILLPGEHRLMQRPASAQARSLGIVAGYRELNTSVWKTTIALLADDDAHFFSFWPSAPERLAVRVKLDESGLVVNTLNRTHR